MYLTWCIVIALQDCNTTTGVIPDIRMWVGERDQNGETKSEYF